MDSVFKNIVKIKAHTKQFRIVLLGLIDTSSEQEVGLNHTFKKNKKQGPTTFTHAVRLLNELTVIVILKKLQNLKHIQHQTGIPTSKQKCLH